MKVNEFIDLIKTNMTPEETRTTDMAFFVNGTFYESNNNLIQGDMKIGLAVKDSKLFLISGNYLTFNGWLENWKMLKEFKKEETILPSPKSLIVVSVNGEEKLFFCNTIEPGCRTKDIFMFGKYIENIIGIIETSDEKIYFNEKININNKRLKFFSATEKEKFEVITKLSTLRRNPFTKEIIQHIK
jgi:hypothetical protein